MTYTQQRLESIIKIILEDSENIIVNKVNDNGYHFLKFYNKKFKVFCYIQINRIDGICLFSLHKRNKETGGGWSFVRNKDFITSETIKSLIMFTFDKVNTSEKNISIKQYLKDSYNYNAITKEFKNYCIENNYIKEVK